MCIKPTRFSVFTIVPLVFAMLTNIASVTDVRAATPKCLDPLSDADGDGWGWENHRSCIVNPDKPDDHDDTLYKGRHPYCSSADADEDGDGWGYENHRSCFVKTGDDDGDDNDDHDDDDDDDDGDRDDKDNDQGDLIFSQTFNTSGLGLYQGDQLNSGWNTPLWHAGFDEGRVTILSDDDDHGKVMQVTYPAGAYGFNGATAFLSDVQFGMGLPKSYNELYLSYDLKFDDNFEFVKGGKLPGLCGANTNEAPSTGCNTGGGYPSGYDGWSARGMWRADGAMENYVYHSGQSNYYGDDEYWNVEAVRGQWHRVQHRVVLNTVGSKDGILEAWFDGEKVLSLNNIEYRRTDSVSINLFYFSTFFGGNDPSWAPATDQTIRFDNFAISTAPIEFD